MGRMQRRVAGFYLVALVGCTTPAGPDAETETDAGTDAGTRDADAPDSPAAGGECSAGDLAVPYGTSIGSRLSPFTLSNCAGESYSFYGPDFCDATLTVLEIQAGGWGPCHTRASTLEREIVERYRPAGVRVIEILIQTYDRAAPELADCQDWSAWYGLTNPVLIDPAQVTQVYFPDRGLPAILIVDAEGIIRYRQYEGGLLPVQAQIEELLGW